MKRFGVVECAKDGETWYEMRERVAGAFVSYEDHAAEVEKLRDGNEQLRVQLAGCSVAAGQNTENSRKERCTREMYGWSPAYQDVCNAVDREIKLRAERDEARSLILECEGVLGYGDEVEKHSLIAKLNLVISRWSAE